MDAGKRAFYLGRYNCVEQIGSGPLGDNFRAKIYGVAGFEKQFAVKRVYERLSGDEAFIGRFVNAASAYAGLDHDRIARVHEVNVQGAQYYVAVDFVRGVDLGKLLTALGNRGEAMPTDVSLLIALDIAEGLEYAHARRDLLPTGVLHLGLWPGAIMVTHEGDTRILDVGLFGSLMQPGWADDDQLLPALAYLAPEELRAEAVEARADVFSLAAILFELVAGQRAFAGESAREVRRSVEAAPPTPPSTDARLQAIITAALQPDAEARPTMSAFREALVPLLGSRAGKARSELHALVRRVARPPSRTGSFAAVAMPTALAPPSPVSDRAWSPPTASGRPAPKTPKPPIGAKLDGPTANTLSGLGADDALLAPLEIVEIPGFPTTQQMNAVADDHPTVPVQKADLTPPPPGDHGQTERVEKAEVEHLEVEGEEPSGVHALKMIADFEDQTPHVGDEDATSRDIPLPPVPDDFGAMPGFEPTDPGKPPTITLTAHPAPAPAPPVPRTPTLEMVVPTIDRPFLPPTLQPRPPERSWGTMLAFLAVLTAGGGVGGWYLWHMLGHAGATTDVPKIEAPKVAAPKVESPKVETPKVDEPKAETPKVDKPKAETPKVVEAPKVETPKVDAPKPETPKVVEAPKVETPKVEAPTVAAGPTSIQSTPPAQLWVDGKNLGTTPLNADVSAARELIFVAEGYKIHKQPPSAPLAVTLEAAGGGSGSGGIKVRCRSKGALRILVDGVDTGRQCPNEERIRAAPGAHKVGLFDPATNTTHDVDVQVGDTEGSTRVYVKF